MTRIGGENRINPLVLFAGGVLYFLLGFNVGINFYDEGVFVYGAARVLNGDVPYRDFWTVHAPAQFYTLAALYKVFGPSMMVARVATLTGLCLLSAVVYLVARKVLPQPYAVLVYVLWVIRAGAYRGFSVNNLYPALLFSLVSALAICRHFATAKRPPLILGGLLAGVATAFRQDYGVYTMVAAGSALGVFGFANPTDFSTTSSRRIMAAGKTIGYYALGVAMVVVPVGVYFVRAAGLRVLIETLVLFPLATYPHYYALPFPSLMPNPLDHTLSENVIAFLIGFPFYFTLGIYALAATRLAARWWKGLVDWGRHEAWCEVLVLALGVALLHHVWRRPDGWHLFAALIPATVLFGVLVSRIREIPKGRFALVLVAASVSVLFVARPIALKAGMAANTVRPAFAFDLERARGIVYDSRSLSYYPDMIRYVQNEVPRGGKIFVGNTRHDRINTNDVLFYFLADRPSATKYHELARGVATTRAIQERIVRELEESRVRWIALRREFGYEPSVGEGMQGADVLDRYLQERFVPVAVFGSYIVGLRRDSSGAGR